jgi:hypothetical protein
MGQACAVSNVAGDTRANVERVFGCIVYTLQTSLL